MKPFSDGCCQYYCILVILSKVVSLLCEFLFKNKVRLQRFGCVHIEGDSWRTTIHNAIVCAGRGCVFHHR